MTKQISFSKQEHLVLPEFRQNINKAESTEEVKKFFTHTAIRLMDEIFEKKISFKYEDIELVPEKKSHFEIRNQVLNQEPFKEVWNHSDMKRILKSFAETSVHRYKHLSLNPEKTELKIRK